MNFLLTIIISVVVGGVIFYWLMRVFGSKEKSTAELSVLNQRFDLLSNSVNSALRDTMKLIADQLKDSRESTERTTLAVNKQVAGFTTGLTTLSENLKQVHE